MWSYSGVRPLYDDGSDDPSAVTRDYHLMLDTARGRAALRCSRCSAARSPPTAGSPSTCWTKLYGRWFQHPRPGRMQSRSPAAKSERRTFDELLLDYRRRYPKLPKVWLARLLRRHGTLADEIIGDASEEAGWARISAADSTSASCAYLVGNEWAREAEDVLWRRTKCGLHMSEEEKRGVRDWLAARV